MLSICFNFTLYDSLIHHCFRKIPYKFYYNIKKTKAMKINNLNILKKRLNLKDKNQKTVYIFKK